MRLNLGLAVIVLVLALVWNFRGSWERSAGIATDSFVRPSPAASGAPDSAEAAAEPSQQGIVSATRQRMPDTAAAGGSFDTRDLPVTTPAHSGGAEVTAAQGVGSGDSSKEAARELATTLASTNLHAAAEWASALPAGEVKTEAVLAVGYEAARSDPVTALELGAQLNPSENRDELLVHSIRQWASAAGPSARQWVEEIQNPALRQKLLAAITVIEAEQDGATAAQQVSRLAAGEEQNRTAVLVAEEWGNQDPAAARKWAEAFPAGPARTGALEALNRATNSPSATQVVDTAALSQ